MHRQFLADLGGGPATEFLHPFVQIERGLHRVAGVVLADHSPEQRDDFIAPELGDQAPPAGDGFDRDLFDRFEYLLHQFRIVRLEQRAVAGEVRAQDGDLPPFPLCRQILQVRIESNVPQRPKRTVRAVGFGVGGRMGKFVTAPAAEICVDRIRMPATHTEFQHRTAPFPTEVVRPTPSSRRGPRIGSKRVPNVAMWRS